jgi:hypothetical protein
VRIHQLFAAIHDSDTAKAEEARPGGKAAGASKAAYTSHGLRVAASIVKWHAETERPLILTRTEEGSACQGGNVCIREDLLYLV